MSYTPVCRQSHLMEGEMLPATVEGQEVLVIWPDGGEPRAYHGTCPHQDVPLRGGYFNGRILTCPVHNWGFDGRSGRGLSPAGCALKELPLRIADGMVEVDVAA
jgi:toluene monooxygenase system ferredoxin subunit